MAFTVLDNEQANRFELHDDDRVAGYVVYRRRPDVVTVVHTEVDQDYEGKGVASQLVRQMLAHIRREQRRLLPECPFVRRYLGRHWDEYSDIVVGMQPPSEASGQ